TEASLRQDKKTSFVGLGRKLRHDFRREELLHILRETSGTGRHIRWRPAWYFCSVCWLDSPRLLLAQGEVAVLPVFVRSNAKPRNAPQDHRLPPSRDSGMPEDSSGGVKLQRSLRGESDCCSYVPFQDTPLPLGEQAR